ncbi:alpha/beta fold hydrolase [Pseudahrensia aquimaris]|uniref:Alpha/beta fold hydrolase n=1 Tax=Pseudahrensia aquimaris TaxID=744461 RepID=A0ABW3F9S2_9HYPH
MPVGRWHLLPGTLCTAEVFSGFLDHLRVPVACRIPWEISQPSVDDYRQKFIQEIRSGDVVCGFSLGAIVAAHHADTLPADCPLILFGINPLPDAPTRKPDRESLRNDVTQYGGRAALANRLRDGKNAMSDDVIERILVMAEQSENLIDAQTQLALTRPGAMDALSQSQAHIIAISGRMDQQADPTHAVKIANSVLRGQFAVLPDVGHYMLLENAQVCANAVASAFEATFSPEKHRS